MSECPDETSDWGSICATCGNRLPARQGPLRGWMSTRNIDANASAAARRSSPLSSLLVVPFQKRRRARDAA